MIYRYFIEYKLYDIQIYLYEMRSGTPKATDDILCSILSSVHMWAGIGISVTIFIIILLFVICYLFSWYFYHHYHNAPSCLLSTLVFSCLGDCQDGADGSRALSQVHFPFI